MRIFLISNMYPSALSARFGVFVKNVEDLLIQQGASFPYKATISWSKGKIQKLFKYGRLYLNVLGISIFKHDYDIIYVHFPLQSAPVVLLAKYLARTKVVLNFHGNDMLYSGLVNRWLFPFQKLLVDISSLVVVPSLAYKKKAIKFFKLNSDQKVYVYPSGGVNRKLFSPGAQPNLRSGLYTLGYASSIIEGKGWKIFLEALLVLKKNGVSYSALMIGSGEEDQKCDDFIKKHQLTEVERIKEVEQAKLPHYFRKMDLFIFPTYREGESLGLVAVEALACGVPVIATDINATNEYIKDGQNGFLVSPKNSEMIAQKVSQFVNLSENEKLKMRACALNVAEKYDSVKTAEMFYKKLQTL